MEYYSPFWGPEAISTIVEPQGALSCQSWTIAILADSDPFCGILLTILESRAIAMIDDPRECLCVYRQQSQFWPILTRFMDYYSPFWGPKASSIVVKPQGALTCRSSTLIVFADSGPFLGILLCFGVPV